MSKKAKLVFIGCLATVLLAMGLAALHTTKTNALGYYAPDSAGTGHDFELPTYFVLSNTSDVDIDDTWVKIYFTKAQYAADSSPTVTIQHADMCTFQSPNYDIGLGFAPASGSKFTEFDIYHTVSSNNTENVGSLYATTYGLVNRSGTSCPSRTLTIQLTPSDYSPYSGYYVAIVKAKRYSGNTGTQNVWRVVAPTGQGNIVGMVGGRDPKHVGLEIVNDTNNTQAYGNYNLRFGPDCSITAPTVRRMHIYDPDNGAAGIQPTPLYFDVYDFTTAQALTYSFYGPGVSGMHKRAGSTTEWEPDNVSDTDTYVDVQFAPGHRYVWRVRNVYDNNTVQLDQPFDSIFGIEGCQNVISGFTATPTAGTPSPDDEESPTKFTFNGSVDINPNSGIYPGTVTRHYYYVKYGTTTQIALAADDVDSYDSANKLVDKSYTKVIGPPLPAFSAGDQICETVTVDPGSGQADSTGQVTSKGPAVTSTPGCFTITNHPYFRVYGNDVWAGGAFKQGSSCPAPVNKPLKGFAKNAGLGAATQFAAGATEAITQFSSASLRTSAPTPSTGLSFANSNVSTAFPTMGGNFGGFNCVTDYFGTTKDPALAATPAPPTPPGAIIDTANGGQVLYQPPTGSVLGLYTERPLCAGTRHTIYVDGDAVITNNVVYCTTTGNQWKVGTLVPFVLVVKGNLYISKDVTQLDGLYVAQPRDDGTKGRIYTCTNSDGSQMAQTSLFDSCNKPLLVHGSFVAQQVKLLRTRGSLRNATAGELANSSNIAETFDFNPEMYLSNPFLNTSTIQYQYITSLPPIL